MRKRMFFNSVLVLLFISVFSFRAHAQREKSITRIILPENSNFKPLLFNPSECQTFGTFGGYELEGKENLKGFVPFGLGVSKGIIRWEYNESRSIQLNLEVGIFPQFEVTWEDGKNLFNTDYKIGLPIAYRFNEKFSCRFNLFHISSHLGDEFLYKNLKYSKKKGLQVNELPPSFKNISYEVVNIVMAWDKEPLRIYVGMGRIIRTSFPTEKWELQCGMEYARRFSFMTHSKFIMGFHSKFSEEYNFNPGIKCGAGFQIGDKRNNSPIILLEYFRGQMPYSAFMFLKVSWAGLGIYYNI